MVSDQRGMNPIANSTINPRAETCRTEVRSNDPMFKSYTVTAERTGLNEQWVQAGSKHRRKIHKGVVAIFNSVLFQPLSCGSPLSVLCRAYIARST